MFKRSLSEAELEYFAEHIWDIDENDPGSSVANDSDLSEDNVDSFSEQELSDEEPVEGSPHEFYVGKNKTTKLSKMRVVILSKTKRRNIVKKSCGVTHRARNIKNEQDAFLKMIDIDMIDNIVSCSNKCIQEMRLNQALYDEVPTTDVFEASRSEEEGPQDIISDHETDMEQEEQDEDNKQSDTFSTTFRSLDFSGGDGTKWKKHATGQRAKYCYPIACCSCRCKKRKHANSVLDVLL
ncbi:hypothetical protein RN001_008871 [Aquatica leii]|uniref:Uncharacterized protein n=1 Tax=Aquatica leii TaxID=1421715 RepID=A0AAN7SRI8_9COLE|nr:hypothetical protein RN001_008871 [Aquatica leii]